MLSNTLGGPITLGTDSLRKDDDEGPHLFAEGDTSAVTQHT